MTSELGLITAEISKLDDEWLEALDDRANFQEWKKTRGHQWSIEYRDLRVKLKDALAEMERS